MDTCHDTAYTQHMHQHHRTNANEHHITLQMTLLSQALGAGVATLAKANKTAAVGLVLLPGAAPAADVAETALAQITSSGCGGGAGREGEGGAGGGGGGG